MKKQFIIFALFISFLCPVVYAQTSVESASDQQTESVDPVFLDQFSQHHSDAIEIAKLAQKRSSSDDIKKMSRKMIAKQTKEIAQMKLWRKTSFRKTPESKAMPSKMDISELKNMSGKDFDKMYLNMMSKHHQEGIDMVSKYQANLQNEKVKSFAVKSKEDQAKEIDEMAKMKVE